MEWDVIHLRKQMTRKGRNEAIQRLKLSKPILIGVAMLRSSQVQSPPKHQRLFE